MQSLIIIIIMQSDIVIILIIIMQSLFKQHFAKLNVWHVTLG